MAESKMIPFTDEAKALALDFLHSVPFASELHHAPVPEFMEPLPPVNKRGGRTVPPEGWKTVYSMVVTQDMCNPLGSLHGGAAATLIDTVSSASNALLSTDSFWGTPMLSGVSVTLDTQYYNACPVWTQVGPQARVTVEKHPAERALDLLFDVPYEPVIGADSSGTKAKITVTIEHLGGTLANLRADITDWETGKRFASGTHVKTWRDLRAKL